jgi:uncharacterized protein YkwD
MRVAVLFLVFCAAALRADDGARIIEKQVLDEVNKVRRSRGLKALQADSKIGALARQHSRNMAERRFFSHDDPKHGDVGERLRAGGVDWMACAENIYRDSGAPDPARSAVRAWMSSAGHRRNLLSKTYTHTGIGVDLRQGHVFTQIFVGK